MNRNSLSLVATAVVALAAFAGCSDAERISDGDRFSSFATGRPGPVLIDNMEDGTQYLLSDDGRTGLWYIYNDASLNAVQEPSLGFPMYRILLDDGTPQPGSAVPPRPCGWVCNGAWPPADCWRSSGPCTSCSTVTAIRAQPTR